MAVNERTLQDLLQAMQHEPQSPAGVRARIESVEYILEQSITLPIINRKIGLDAIIGLIPVGGDVIAGLISAYAIWEARNLGMSKWQMTRMAGNTLFDTTLGAIPLVGDMLDFFFQSNTRNLRIIRKHLDRHHPHTATIEGKVTRRARR